MNHLAHFHLAGDCPGHVFGALLADQLRGPLRGTWPAAVESGVQLHRRIDAVTDSHPVVRALRSSFEPGERRLAGIVLDLWFDHFLALHWNQFDTRQLSDFGDSVYAVLRTHHQVMPEATRVAAERMEKYALLSGYAKTGIVEGALERIGERLHLGAQMSAAIRRARDLLPAIERGFLDLYPELRAMASGYLNAGL